MEEEFGVQVNDTVPITGTSSPIKTEESKPLQFEKETEGHSGNILSLKPVDPVVKYRNLESDLSDGNGNETKISNVHLQCKFVWRGGCRLDDHMVFSLSHHLSSFNLQFGSSVNGSVWSIPSSSASTAVHSIKWYRHPKVREHWKVVVASFVLFFIGLCLCIVGVILEALEVQTGGIFMLFVIGIICFIPGVYHVIAVYCAVKGKRGFSFYNLPLFN